MIYLILIIICLKLFISFTSSSFTEMIELPISNNQAVHIIKKYYNITNNNDGSKFLFIIIKDGLYSKGLFNNIFLNDENNNKIMEIKFIIESKFFDVNNIDSETIGNDLDMFIQHRLWWIIKNEVYQNKYKRKYKFDLNIIDDDEYPDFIQNEAKSYSYIHLTRYNKKFESYLRLISKKQYLSKEECLKTGLDVYSNVGQGYGSQILTLESFNLYHISNVKLIYDSLTNSVDDGLLYVEKSTCPNLKNKRLCAYLPTTNCSLPVVLNDLDTLHKIQSSQIEHFNIVNEQGIISINNEPNEAKSVYYQELEKVYSRDKYSQQFLFNENSKFITYDGKNIIDKNDLNSQKTKYALGFLHSFGLEYRWNSLFRDLIKRRIEYLHHFSPFSFHSELSVAIHIRRGDRIRIGNNNNPSIQEVREFCLNYTFIDWQTPVRHKLNPSITVNAGTYQDLGCLGSNPFGGLYLQDYLDKVSLLVNTKNVFIMTDDGEWLNDQMKLVSKEWKILTIPGRINSRGINVNSTKNGVDFFTSIAISRKCSGFIGHWGSSVSVMIYNAMCYMYKNYTGICPPGYDFSNQH